MTDLHPEVKMRLMKRWETRGVRMMFVTMIATGVAALIVTLLGLDQAAMLAVFIVGSALSGTFIGYFQGLIKGISFDDDDPLIRKVMDKS